MATMIPQSPGMGFAAPPSPAKGFAAPPSPAMGYEASPQQHSPGMMNLQAMWGGGLPYAPMQYLNGMNPQQMQQMQMQQMQMQQMQMQMQQMQKTQMQQMQSQTQMQPMQSMPKAPPSGLGPHSSPPSAVPNRPTALPNGAVPADAAYAKPLANVREDASGSPTGRAEKHPLSAPTGGAARIIMPRYNEPRASSYPYVVNRGR